MVEAVETPVDEVSSRTVAVWTAELLPALERLDRLLERAVTAAEATFGPQAAADPFRGLYIRRDEAERLLARPPGGRALLLAGGDAPAAGSPGPLSPLNRLCQTFHLAPFDLDLILIALAPDLDLRYERLYAYLQDDVTRRRPSVDLALNLLCSSVEAKLARRAHFAPDAPVIRHGILHLVADPAQPQAPLLACALKLDEQIVRLVLGEPGLDGRLAPFCRLVEPVASLHDLPLRDETKRALHAVVRDARGTGRPLRLYFQGPDGGSKYQAAAALAAEAGSPLLTVDLARALDTKTFGVQAAQLVVREACWRGAVLYLEGLDALRGDDAVLPDRSLVEALSGRAGITILAGEQPWTPAGRPPLDVVAVPFPMPHFAGRRACWQAGLAAAGVALPTEDLDALAGRFQLTADQITSAVGAARSMARWRAAVRAPGELPSAAGEPPATAELFAAARAQSGHDLATLARRIEPAYTWHDIVLPGDALAQLREICGRVTQRQRVLGAWGFDRKLSLGKGVNALFAGPSGTGKTMAAEIIAAELGLDLYRIDLSGVVSKYIGETEKNLERIFTAATNANAILFFDEADALFGKRSEVRDSHDRYANIEISYLLQKMEEYEGIAVLATNLRHNLDDAFVRRLAFTVHFPFPDEASRQRIWAGVWPAETPLGADVDLALLAARFKLSGGNIKNVALAAAFQAAETGGPVTMSHLRHALRREYQKMGSALAEPDLASAHDGPAPAAGGVR